MTCPHPRGCACASWRQRCYCPWNRWPTPSSEPCSSGYARRVWKTRQKPDGGTCLATCVPNRRENRIRCSDGCSHGKKHGENQYPAEILIASFLDGPFWNVFSEKKGVREKMTVDLTGSTN